MNANIEEEIEEGGSFLDELNGEADGIESSLLAPESEVELEDEPEQEEEEEDSFELGEEEEDESDEPEEEESEEAEEEDEPEEEEEDEDPKPLTPEEAYEQAKAFAKGKKQGELRAELAARSAQISALEAREKEREEAAYKLEQDREAFEREKIENATRVKPITIDDYQPYKETIAKFESLSKRTKSALFNRESQQIFDDQKVALSQQMLAVKSADELREFKGRLEDVFGNEEDAEETFKFLKEVRVLDSEAREIRERFDEEVQEQSVKKHFETLQESKKSLMTQAKALYTPDEEFMNKNPMHLRSVVARAVGDDLDRYVQKDVAFTSKLINGLEPFDPDSSEYAGMTPEQAKKSYVKELNENEKMRAKLLPELVLSGLMSHRILPKLATEVSKKRPKSKTPSPSQVKAPKSSKGSPKSLEEELEEANREFADLV